MITIEINKDKAEQDIELILPSGKKVLIQHRYYESDSSNIDICFEDNVDVVNWCDDEMTPAKLHPKNPGIMQNVKQIYFSID